MMFEGEEARKVARAFSSETCYRILQLLARESLDVSTISRRLRLSEAHVSGEVSLLQDLKLIKVNYAPGKRGIRKMCELAVEKILIVIKTSKGATSSYALT